MSKRGKGKKRTRKQKIKQQRKEMRDMTYKQNNYTYQRPECHSGQHEVLVIGKGDDAIHLYAGGRNRSGGWWKQPLAQLAMGPDETMRPLSGRGVAQDATTVPEGFTCAQHIPVYEPPLLVELDFPDFGIPTVPASFWYALVEDIHSHNIKHISMQCAGGHGRTGVQLCIMLYLLAPGSRDQWPDATTLLEYVRDAYCDHAVETAAQLDYVADVLSIPLGSGFVSHKAGGWSGNVQPATAGGGTSKQATLTWDDFDERDIWMLNKGVDNDCQCYDEQDPIPDDMVDDLGMCLICDKEVDVSRIDLDNDTPSSSVPKCPCCDVVSDEPFDNKGCVSCGYVNPSKNMYTKRTCSECGLDAPRIEFLEDEDPCLSCLTRYNADVSIRYGKTKGGGKVDKVRCYACKTFQPIAHIIGFSTKATSPQSPVCYKCDAKERGMN